MNQRDQNLLQLRPLIPTITQNNIATLAEQFQNQTLRPILKMQNDLLVAIFQQYIIQRKNVFPSLSPTKKMEYIEQSVRKDLKFRSLLLGVVVGQFTIQEWNQFAQNESELRKRMVVMLVERLKSNFR